MSRPHLYGGLLLAAFVSFSIGCTTADQGGGAGEQSRGVRIDGSSTVFLISEAVAEEFRKQHADVDISLGSSGTGGGMKKFYAGEIDICDASRAMKEIERENCEKNGVEFIELWVAYDGLAVVVNRQNDWAKSMTVEQLKRLWEPDSKVKQWSDLDPAWPAEEISLYGPGDSSGTFDYFTEEICGKEAASRADYTASEDDNVLVNGVANSKYALGYFGFAYYVANKDSLNVIGVDNGNGPVTPSIETVRDQSYAPLSRPLFVYVRKDSLKRPEVAEFVQFYIDNCGVLAEEVGYVALDEGPMEKNRAAAFRDRQVASGWLSGLRIDAVLEQPSHEKRWPPSGTPDLLGAMAVRGAFRRDYRRDSGRAVGRVAAVLPRSRN